MSKGKGVESAVVGLKNDEAEVQERKQQTTVESFIEALRDFESSEIAPAKTDDKTMISLRRGMNAFIEFQNQWLRENKLTLRDKPARQMYRQMQRLRDTMIREKNAPEILKNMFRKSITGQIEKIQRSGAINTLEGLKTAKDMMDLSVSISEGRFSECIREGHFYSKKGEYIDEEKGKKAEALLLAQGYKVERVLKSGPMGVVLHVQDLAGKNLIVKLPPVDKERARKLKLDEEKLYEHGGRAFENEINSTEVVSKQLQAQGSHAAYFANPKTIELANDVKVLVSDFIACDSSNKAIDVEHWMKDEGKIIPPLSDEDIETIVAKLDKVFNNAFASQDALHDLGVLHLDFAPRNTMITENLGVKAIDFGVSKKVQADGVAENWVVGTLAYEAIFDNRKDPDQPYDPPSITSDYFARRMFIISSYAHFLGLSEGIIETKVMQPRDIVTAEYRLERALAYIEKVAANSTLADDKDPAVAEDKARAVIVQKSIEKYGKYLTTFDFSHCKDLSEMRDKEKEFLKLVGEKRIRTENTIDMVQANQTARYAPVVAPSYSTPMLPATTNLGDSVSMAPSYSTPMLPATTNLGDSVSMAPSYSTPMLPATTNLGYGVNMPQESMAPSYTTPSSNDSNTGSDNVDKAPANEQTENASVDVAHASQTTENVSVAETHSEDTKANDEPVAQDQKHSREPSGLPAWAGSGSSHALNKDSEKSVSKAKQAGDTSQADTTAHVTTDDEPKNSGPH